MMVYDLFIDCFPYWHRRGRRGVLHPGSRVIFALNPVTGWGFSPKIPIPAILGPKNPVPPLSQDKKSLTPPKVDVKKIAPPLTKLIMSPKHLICILCPFLRHLYTLKKNDPPELCCKKFDPPPDSCSKQY